MTEDNEQLMSTYPAPLGSDFRISQVLLEPTLTADNYRTRMHDLLYVEEIAQYANIARSVASVRVTNELIQLEFHSKFIYFLVDFSLFFPD